MVQPEKAEKKNVAQRFFERWNVELKKVSDGINAADREARVKLQTVNADVLRRAGLRETAYGVALTSLQAATAGFGASVGGLAGFGAGLVSGASIGAVGGAALTSEFGPIALFGGMVGLASGAFVGAGLGALAGNQIGVELAGWVYHKFVRKLDPELQPLAKVDWVVGQFPGLNPPIVGGLRNMFEGFFGLAAKREESQLSAVSAQLSAVK